MSATRIVLGVLVFLGASILATAAVSQDRGPPDPNDKAPTLQVRIADARLRLAQTELQIRLDLNKKIPGAISEFEIQRLKNNIDGQ